MSHNTSRLALIELDGTDNVSAFPSAFNADMATLDAAALYVAGIFAGRPSTGSQPAGTFYYATDTGVLYQNSGSSWNYVASSQAPAALYQSGVAGSRPAASSVLSGSFYYATDTGVLSLAVGGTWFGVAVTSTGLHLPGRLAWTNTTVSVTAASGQFVNCTVAGPITVTLPAASLDAIVGVSASSTQTGASPVTVSYGSGGGAIYGPGLGASGSATLLLGSPNAVAVLESDGTNWSLVSGQQDTGWLGLALGTNIGDQQPNTGTGYTVGVRLTGDKGWLRGGVYNNTGGAITSTVLATVPTACRPAQLVTIPLLTSSLQGGYVTINTSGQIQAYASASFANGTRFYWDGLTYPTA